MKFNHKSSTVFLDPNSPETYSALVDEKINIILSPSLYWVKKISLPVKNERDAKKLLPSLFEDTLPEGNYSYSVYKKDDEFLIFAYEDKKILEVISKVGIITSNIASIYFAQSVLENTKGAMKVNETQSIYVKDGIVLLVPCCWIEESGKLNLSDITLSKHKISLQQYGHLTNNASFYKFNIILTVFIVLLFGQYFIVKNKTNNILELKDKVFERYHLKSTSFQNISMLKKYKNIHTKQTNFREYLSYILSLKFKANEKLSKITLDKGKLNVEFLGATPSTLVLVRNKLKSKEVKFKIHLKSKILYLEMVL